MFSLITPKVIYLFAVNSLFIYVDNKDGTTRASSDTDDILNISTAYYKDLYRAEKDLQGTEDLLRNIDMKLKLPPH